MEDNKKNKNTYKKSSEFAGMKRKYNSNNNKSQNFFYPILAISLLILFVIGGYIYSSYKKVDTAHTKPKLVTELQKIFTQEDAESLKTGAVVTIFSTWCKFCHIEHLYLVDIAKKYPDIPIYGILYKDQENNLVNFLKNRENIFKNIYQKVNTKICQNNLNVVTIPKTFIIYDDKVLLSLDSSMSYRSLTREVIPALEKIQKDKNIMRQQ